MQSDQPTAEEVHMGASLGEIKIDFNNAWRSSDYFTTKWKNAKKKGESQPDARAPPKN